MLRDLLTLRRPFGGDSTEAALEERFVQSTTILLGDDNSAVLDHVGKMLEKEGSYKVVGAVSDGRTVVREYLRLRPEVVILDISMGDVSGIDVARVVL